MSSAKQLTNSTWRVFVLVGVVFALFLLFQSSEQQYKEPTVPVTEETEDKWEENPKNFYRDESFGYTMNNPMEDWDQKRLQWLKYHRPNNIEMKTSSSRPKILLLSGSQSQSCNNPIGDHLQLRALKNKQDYSRLHGIDMFYNTALLDPKMVTYWAKIPLIRAAMAAHPEAEWIWWMDSDAIITDMEFELPLERYNNSNLVVYGWEDLIYNNRSWVSLNAGVFLIRNCEWSLKLMERWASMGPSSPLYGPMAQMLSDFLPDRRVMDSDDQSALVYLMIKERPRWRSKIYVENSYYFQGYWVDIVGGLQNVTRRYEDLERRNSLLGMRFAEKDARVLWDLKEEVLRREHLDGILERRPFITHFTGCQPCNGKHNKDYKGEDCWNGLVTALDFADDQVLRAYGFRRSHSDQIVPL